MTIEQAKDALIASVCRLNNNGDYVGARNCAEAYKLLCEAELMTLSGKQTGAYKKNMQMMERSVAGENP
jgi:hypothetical protein